MEICANPSVDELYQRWAHSAGTVQHGAERQITAVPSNQHAASGMLQQQEFQRRRTSKKPIVH